MSEQISGMVVPVSYCCICDAGKIALEIPTEPCGHTDAHKRTFGLPVVPTDPMIHIPKQTRS